jgi:hypothetical protein
VLLIIMRNLFSLCGSLAVLALGAGCDQSLFSAKIEAPEVCLGGLAVPFPPDSFDVASEDTISADELGMPDDENLDLTVNVRSLALTPMAGVSDLGFIDVLNVHAAPADPASQLPWVALIAMDGTSMMADGSMYGEPPSPVDISDHLRSGDILFRIDAAGERPDFMWMAEMELCVDAVARYEF